jgi:hypothetical protein
MLQESGIRNEFFKGSYNVGCRYFVVQNQSGKISFIPDESTLRKNDLDACYQETIFNIREEIGDSYIWVALDETTDVLGCFVAKLIVGKLDPEAPCRSFQIFSKVLEQTNHSTVARFVNNGLKILRPQVYRRKRCLCCIQTPQPAR